jgi:prolyl oligopeptidase
VDVYQSASQGDVSVEDPYQWLEEDKEETDEWTTAQEAFTREYLDKNPDLERLRNAFRDCLDYPKVRKYPISSTYHDTEQTFSVLRSPAIR